MIEVFEKISDKVRKASIPPRILLRKFRFIEESSRYSRECLDPYYMPFYYYLGVFYPCKNLLEFGFGLGLGASCYMMGCKDVENYLTLQEKTDTYYSNRIGRANVRQVYHKNVNIHIGHVYDESFSIKDRKWDLVLISDKKGYDEQLAWLNAAWDNCEGLICIDYTTSHEHTKRAYYDFCTIKNRKPYVFPTRYGVGAIAIAR